MKKSIIGGLSAAVLSLAMAQAAPVYAMDHSSHKEGQCIMQKLERLKESLALTPDQEKQLKAVTSKSKAFMKQNHQAKKEVRKEARVIADAKDIDRVKLDKLAAKAGQLESDRLKNRVMAKHEINQILTDEQKAKLKNSKMKHNKMKHKPMQ
jgi:Spy/CpxP family protein refolding chaperone